MLKRLREQLTPLFANREPMRLAVQTIIAVAAAYLLALILRLPDPSWSVFSAIFVLQLSVGGTINVAIDRVVGAVIGMIVGLICLAIIGFGEWHTLLSLAISVGIMALVSGYWPRYNYGLVAVAMLVVAPDFEMVEGAFWRAAAIALGSCCGAIVGAVIMPVRAHQRARYHLGQAVCLCGNLLNASMGRARSGEKADLIAIHDTIAAELRKAQDMMTQSRKRPGTQGWPARNWRVYREVDRLWYTLALADRSSSMPLAQDLMAHLDTASDEAMKSCCHYLHDFGHAYAAGNDVPQAEGLNGPLAALHDAVVELRSQRMTLDRDLREVERLFTLSFAWEQVAENIKSLAEATRADQKKEAA
ncbi:FUSC family protein [Tianweitania sp. BSSL-BM11]|uniref:FUSC family protein n=1 Tax=Tianweitania aestuarii TaxID=2814886 RepID=A0ABS5RZ09_9HYPH|nr:FUSC family protein [Tianweitania aestuarii]MBS9720897.1 FUSC family protein [Tianweitania aestuarii]